MTASRSLGTVQKTPESKPTLLLVEDEMEMRQILRSLLREHGYRVVEATTGEQAIAVAFEIRPALVVLDLGLPDIDGIRVAQHIREFSRIPILVVSARSTERDIVEALDRGANDYVTKPFRERELFARVRSLLRTFAWVDDAEFAFGEIRIDPVSRRVWVEGRDAKLSATEYRLLSVLIRAGGSAVTHRQLLHEVWGPGHAGELQYLRVYMRYLREKLEIDPAKPQYLLTETGIGYRLRTSSGSPEFPQLAPNILELLDVTSVAIRVFGGGWLLIYGRSSGM
jgi:two-component system KDP operon response regulator KdpE